MAKKQSGLGRSLGDLFEDNTPALRSGATVVKREGGEEIPVTPTSGGPADTRARGQVQPQVQVQEPKPLYEERPKNRSLKANFKNFGK